MMYLNGQQIFGQQAAEITSKQMKNLKGKIYQQKQSWFQLPDRKKRAFARKKQKNIPQKFRGILIKYRQSSCLAKFENEETST